MPKRELDFLLITKQFPPRLGGRSSLFGEIARSFPDNHLLVSTPHHRGARRLDRQFTADVLRAPTFFFGARGVGLSLWEKRLRWLCRSRPPALTVAGGVEPEGSFALLLRQQFGIPYVLHLEGPQLLEIRNEIRKAGEAGAARRRLLAGAEALLVPSHACRFEAYKLDIYPHRIQVLRPGVDLERFRPGEPSAELTRRLETGQGPVVLSVLGESPAKDVETVLRAFAAVQAQRTGAVLVLVGGGEQDPWRRLCRKLNVEPAVRFVGPVDPAELPDYYRLADVFTLAHKEDRDSWIVQGVEMAFLEAMASGVPIAATRTSSTEEVVPHEDVGLLAEPEAHARLSRAILDLLRGNGGAEEFGRRARARAEAQFDGTATGAALREFLRVLYYRRLGLETLPPPEPAVSTEEQAHPTG